MPSMFQSKYTTTGPYSICILSDSDLEVNKVWVIILPIKVKFDVNNFMLLS